MSHAIPIPHASLMKGPSSAYERALELSPGEPGLLHNYALFRQRRAAGGGGSGSAGSGGGGGGGGGGGA